MDVLKQLENWIQERDYESGLVILAKLSKNRILLQNLNRKKHPDKLFSELKKLAGHYHIKFTQSKDVRSNPKEGTPKAVLKEELTKDISPASSEIIENKLDELESAADELISDKIEELEHLADDFFSGKRKTITQKRHVNYEDLPNDLKSIWQQNRDSYKEIRALHEKLKLMERATPEDRRPLTERIASLDEMIRTNWETIDTWDPEAPAEEKIPVEVDFKRLRANRKYISTGLKKLSNRNMPESRIEELKNNMFARAKELISAGENFSPETIRDLKSIGINI